MNRRTGSRLWILAALGIAGGCQLDRPGDGGDGVVSVSIPLTVTDVARIVASVTGTGIAAPITSDLVIGGPPPAASGVIRGVPAGTERRVTLEGYPALAGSPEADVAIYRGTATVDVVAGGTTAVSITMLPVNGEVQVTAAIPNDADLAAIDHVTVAVTGPRIAQAPTYYLTPALATGTASGIAAGIPVGSERRFTVTTHAAGGAALHSGTASAPVTETGTAVSVALANVTGVGNVSVGGSFCVPDCTGLVCGSDGCGGSCGGCPPGIACVSGVCAPAQRYAMTTSAAPLGAGPPIDTVNVDDDIWIAVNGATIVDDTDGIISNLTVEFDARPGDVIHVVARNGVLGPAAVSPLYLHRLSDGAVQVLDAAGVPYATPAPGEVFYDASFTVH
jgi:hypothetical protein